MSPPTPDELRATLDKLSVVIEYFKRDLEETRRQVREEFVTMREYKQLQSSVDENRRAAAKELDETKKALADAIAAVATKTVTKDEFTPVKSVVFGVVGTILLTVIGALLVLVVRRGG